MMDAIFRAGRALGRAEAMRLNEKDGASYVRDAISEMNRSSNAGVRGVVPHAQGLVNNWVRRKDELPGLIAAIRDTHILGMGDNKGYQSFCCGLLLGLALEACRQVGPDTVTKIAITRVGEWMSGAKLHAEALKLQNLVPGMADFGARFNTLLTPLGFVQSSAELKNYASLIEALSNDVGNAIH